MSELFSDPVQAFHRGAFKRIAANEIDLPAERPPPNLEQSRLWITSLPDELQKAFCTEYNQHFTLPLTKYIEKHTQARSLPVPKLHASQRNYVKLLNNLDSAGMLHWSVVNQEDQSYTRIAEVIEMTLFAVSKTKSRSRLISWPRIQNDALPDPPPTTLPDPSLFEAIQINGSSPSTFYLDVSNMFHNITLPPWLAKLFPMRPIKMSKLSRKTQERLRTRLHINNLTEDILLRPCQATMPMGFKWSVYIAQTFTAKCLDQAFIIFKSSRFAPPGLSSVQTLRKDQAPFILQADKPILMHIIDNVTVLTSDWADDSVRAWHRITRRCLELNHLPVNGSKSCDLNHVEKESVDFIGCLIDLVQMEIQPSPTKLCAITNQISVLLAAQITTKRQWQRMLGKLVWFATLSRPLLACMQKVFQVTRGLHEDDEFEIDERAKQELWMLAALLPLARVTMQLPLAHMLVAFDASQSAGAVVYTFVTPELAANLWSQGQKARFTKQQSYESNLPAVHEAVTQYRWKKAFIHRWKRPEHINALKAAAAVLAIEWFVRMGIQHTRWLVLTDSLVVLGSFQKGRSSSPPLLARCRRFGALALAHRIRPAIAYVKSENNPADKDTRLPEEAQG